MSFDKDSPPMIVTRMDLNAALDRLGTMRDEAVRQKHPQARDLSIAITCVEDALFRVNRAAHTP